MTDYIMEERGWQDHEMLHAGAYLGLGVHEHWDNFTNKNYTSIEYITLDCDDPVISVIPKHTYLIYFLLLFLLCFLIVGLRPLSNSSVP